ncbi:MAG: protein kinase [Chloroflexota bacterium]
MVEIYSYPLKKSDTFRGYYIKGELGNGYRGKTYIASHNGKDYVIKIPNLDIERPKKEIEKRTNEIRQDVMREVVAWTRISENPSIQPYIAKVEDVGSSVFDINKSQYMMPYIIQEYIQGESLEEWCTNVYGKPFNGVTESKSWFSLAKKLLTLLSMIHIERVVHGDIWPPNIIINNTQDPNPILIDFGQAWLVDHEFGLSTNDPSYPYYAPERISNGDIWREPADIFSLGGILYYLATGETPPAVFIYQSGTKADIILKEHIVLKYEILQKVKSLNPQLYQQNPGIVDIILYCLRPDINDRASYAEAVLDVLELFEAAFSYPGNRIENTNKDIFGELAEKVSELSDLVQLLQNTDIHLFPRILKRDVRLVYTRLQTVKSRVYNLEGDRETFINGLLSCVSLLEAKDQLLALTTPTFWRKENFGNYGRLLTMIKMAGLRNISVKWVLLLSDDEFKKPEVKDILQAQSYVMQELSNNGITVGKASSDTGDYYVGYVIVDAETRKAVARQSKTFILINRVAQEKDNYTLINPRYTRSEGRVTLVRFWNDPNRLEEFLDDLEYYSNLSSSLLKLVK